MKITKRKSHINGIGRMVLWTILISGLMLLALWFMWIYYSNGDQDISAMLITITILWFGYSCGGGLTAYYNYKKTNGTKTKHEDNTK